MIDKYSTVILADGDFPSTPVTMRILKQAERIVCCDGSAASLAEFGLEPTVVIGDLDSLPPEFKKRFSDRLIHVREQETNDLTKAFTYCREQGWKNIVILGATGKREDHTLGNLSLLADYSEFVPEFFQALPSSRPLFWQCAHCSRWSRWCCCT